jgi:hypothetical protein
VRSVTLKVKSATSPELQVHQAVGELNCSGEQYTEVPEYEATT